jgi:hypothetical protein
MKHTVFMALMATAALPLAASAQYTQPIPENVKEIRLEDYAALRVVQGDQTRLQVDTEQKRVGKLKGSTLVLNDGNTEMTLFLAPGRVIAFTTQDFSHLNFDGDFAPMDSLVLHIEDYSKVDYSGKEGDTLRARTLRVYCEDFSRLFSTKPVQYGSGDQSASDYSSIDHAATDLSHSLAVGDTLHNSYSNSDFATINSGRYTIDGVLQHEREEVADDAIKTMARIGSYTGDFVRAANETKQKKTAKRNRHPWKTEIDLAFGWHNWGSELGSGFSGVEGAAAVNTNFHNIQLAVNIPVINVRGFAFKAGLGFDWDRYNFITPEVFFDAGANPMTFAAGTAGSAVATSRLKTRHVVVPLKFEFGNRDKWRFSITALPGLNWSGNNTGLRRKVEVMGGTNKEKDYSVNRYFNAYSLDVRAAVQYGGIGLYVQTAMVPLLKDGCQELFPVKFGIIL